MSVEIGVLADAKLQAVVEAVGSYALPRWRQFTAGEWLGGLAFAESRGQPTARRYEPHRDREQRSDHWTDADIPDQDDGALEDDASYGLTQILGSTARELVGIAPGTPANFGFLFRPALNVVLGATYLHRVIKEVAQEHSAATTDDLVTRALCRYNGGPTGDRVMADGKFRRQPYVDRVVQHTMILRRVWSGQEEG